MKLTGPEVAAKLEGIEAGAVALLREITLTNEAARSVLDQHEETLRQLDRRDRTIEALKDNLREFQQELEAARKEALGQAVPTDHYQDQIDDLHAQLDAKDQIIRDLKRKIGESAP